MRILVCVLSCEKNRELWPKILSRMDKDILIFCGSDVTRLDGSILYLNCNDFYEGLPEKVVSMIDQVLTLECFNDVTHILKVDDHDDIFTSDDIKRLYSLDALWQHDYIGQELREVPGSGYGGYHFEKVTKGSYWDSRLYTGPFTSWVDGGHSYILTRTALQIINNRYNSKNLNIVRTKEIYEDVMIANILSEYEIKPFVVSYLSKGAIKIA